MKEYLYHGSSHFGITELEARSKLHNTDKKVVYLTENIPYALYYIWDNEHNGYSEKYVTGWIKNDSAYYEEQFPNQLKTFYKGVSGYLYCISKTSDIQPVDNRECMYYSLENVVVDKVEYINDVYDELLKYEELGKFKVLRYNEQSKKRQDELIDLISMHIMESNFFRSNEATAKFMKKHFVEAWEKAIKQK
ncbi:MAG: hypothetical protein ACRCXT_21260 [Paraclostridium sp.]